MSEIASVAATIFRNATGARRFIVAIAGPPGAGKSTFSELLRELLPEGSAVVIQMDGFHLDDEILRQRGLERRKGAPETFDYAGFEHLLRRIRQGEPDIAVPVFDRETEIARAGAAVVGADVKFVLVEGNYLLLDEAPWSGLAPLLDFGIFLDVPREDIERRLLQRWSEHGKSEEEARDRLTSSDLPNVDRVLQKRRKADLVF